MYNNYWWNVKPRSLLGSLFSFVNCGMKGLGRRPCFPNLPHLNDVGIEVCKVNEDCWKFRILGPHRNLLNFQGQRGGEERRKRRGGKERRKGGGRRRWRDKGDRKGGFLPLRSLWWGSAWISRGRVVNQSLKPWGRMIRRLPGRFSSEGPPFGDAGCEPISLWGQRWGWHRMLSRDKWLFFW